MSTTTPSRRETELGIEKQCADCGAYWTADRDFFYAHPTSSDGLRSVCRACRIESQRKSKGFFTTPRAVPDLFRAVQWGQAGA